MCIALLSRSECAVRGYFLCLGWPLQEHDEGVSDAECGEHLFKDAAVGNEATAASLASVTRLGEWGMGLLNHPLLCNPAKHKAVTW